MQPTATEQTGVRSGMRPMFLSIVFPVFNEEEALPKLFDAMRPIMNSIGCDYELVFVDDGSKDATPHILAAAATNDSHIRVVSFSRNFGHQAAVTAGLDFAEGDAVVVMDADLQDPPELLPQMLELYHQGFDVVSAQRISREGDSLFKRLTAKWFYALMRNAVDPRLQPEVGDFRLFSRRAVLSIRRMREQHRFMRGMVAWLGMKEAILPFHRQPRVAGVTKYPTWKMLKFAWTAISSFSALPLKISLYAGLLLMMSGLTYGLWLFIDAVALGRSGHGWGSLVCLELIFNGAVLSALGLLGDYVARIYEESKARPLYVVSPSPHLRSFDVQPARAIVIRRETAVGEDFSDADFLPVFHARER